jgi:uncharacterized protein YkwD
MEHRFKRLVVGGLILASMSLFDPGSPPFSILSSTPVCPAASPRTGSQDASIEVLERSTFDRVNRERMARGLPPFRLDDHLTGAARRHSQDMADRRFMDHINPDGYSFVDRARLAGARHARQIAENLGMQRGNADPVMEIVRGWINSPHHRRNMLNPRFRCTGIGVARAADGTIYFTQLFADRS